VRGVPVDADVADADVADAGAVEALAAAVADDPGRLDVLVNNAAAFVDWTETTSGADPDAAHRVLETNLFGAWRATVALRRAWQPSWPTRRSSSTRSAQG
jgi:NAD(P)-dependent dehydrogenase (short-subunit alcohol dehydrogenase family)